MIRLTRINHSPFVLNCDLIELIELVPDTVVTLTTGQKLCVLESADEIVQRSIEYRRAANASRDECRYAVQLANAAEDPDGLRSAASPSQ